LPTPFTSLRILACLAAGVLMAFGVAARAQQPGVFSYRWNDAPPADAITPADIREALMWTGHLDASFKGELSAAVLQATQAWQKSKSHKPSDKLTDEQTKDLIQQGLKERDAVGWSIFRDPGVGFAIGIPAKLVTFGTPRMENTSLLYPGTGSVQEVIGVSHGYPNCRNIDGVYARMKTGAASSLKKENWFVALFRGADYSSYYKMTCYATGSIWTEITVPNDMLEKHPGLFSMMAHSVVLLRNPDPTVRPRPRVDDLPAASSGFSDEQVARPQAKSKPAKTSTIDESGKTHSVKLETRGGPDLRAEEVFDKAAAAVYVVKADRRLGSAVAISDSELLTNCHVTGDLAEVKIARAKDEQSAKVVSRAAEADRCVLRVTTKLPSWVTVRPYDDIKVGERAITIGTPQGLELTAAEGIVSSKRTYNQSRVIQTSAPISQGSSGGGLFDARGHLLGITTFYVKAGQNLNFAVAAEEFAQDSDEQANR
jgi:S1-C subfamily serine protease